MLAANAGSSGQLGTEEAGRRAAVYRGWQRGTGVVQWHSEARLHNAEVVYRGVGVLIELVDRKVYPERECYAERGDAVMRSGRRRKAEFDAAAAAAGERVNDAELRMGWSQGALESQS